MASLACTITLLGCSSAIYASGISQSRIKHSAVAQLHILFPVRCCMRLFEGSSNPANNLVLGSMLLPVWIRPL